MAPLPLVQIPQTLFSLQFLFMEIKTLNSPPYFPSCDNGLEQVFFSCSLFGFGS